MQRFVLLLTSMFTFGVVYALPVAITFPKKPGPRDFIVDKANLISPKVEEKLRERLDKLLREKFVPILVVTIPSLARYGAKDTPIEIYATELYNTWGIGHKKVVIRGPGLGRQEVRDWNRGILLLIVSQDRKAWIKLGAGYAPQMEQTCWQVMQHILPYFRKGEYEQGIIQGVLALETTVRKEEIPPPPRPLWHYLLIAAAAVLGVFTAILIYRSESSLKIWILWGIVFGILKIILTESFDSGFEGGAFGGGFTKISKY